MPYVNDPSELALLPELVSDIPVEEPRDYHEFFWDEAVERGRYASGYERAYTQVCRFDDNGEHITMAKDCPHFELEDETGKMIREGWTVQQNVPV
jgi:hypothetical protein